MLLLVAYDADRNGRPFTLRHGVLPWLKPLEGYVMGWMLVVGTLYAIVRDPARPGGQGRNFSGD